MDPIIKALIMPVVLVIILIYLIHGFIKISNKLNRLKVVVNESKKNVDIALAKRYDTITQMLKIAKSFANHENITFTEVIKHRGGASAAEIDKTIDKQNKAINKIFALAEAYPELKSSDQFLKLQDEINDENEQLAAAKRIANSNISILNQEIVSFPTSIVAKIKNMRELEFLTEDNLNLKKSLDDIEYNIS